MSASSFGTQTYLEIGTVICIVIDKIRKNEVADVQRQHDRIILVKLAVENLVVEVISVDTLQGDLNIRMITYSQKKH
jgi:hypothetical protein